MEDDDGIDMLFEQKENEGLFVLEDNKLKSARQEAKQLQLKLTEFINTRLDPDDKNDLEELLDNRDTAYSSCFGIEHRLYYKQGVNDGIVMAITSLKAKVPFTK